MTLLSVLILGFISVYRDSAAGMAFQWFNSSTYHHCPVIVFLAGYVAWLERDRLRGVPTGTFLPALLFIASNSVLWLVARLSDIAFFEHLALVGMVIGTICALIGRQMARLLWFPLAYLYFMVPEGDVLVPALQDWTAFAAVGLLKLVGVPALLEGHHLSLPNGNFVVAEVCSGISYLIAGVAVGSLFLYLRFRSPWRRLAFLILLVAVPVLGNGLRAFGIALVAYLSDFRLAVGVDHFIAGGVFFGVLMLVLFLVGETFSDVKDRQERWDRGSTPGQTGKDRPLVTFLLVAVLLPAPAWALNKLQDVSHEPWTTLAPSIDAWEGPYALLTSMTGAEFPGSERTSARYVQPGGGVVSVDVVHFNRERPGAELVGGNNRLFDPAQFRLDSRGMRASSAPGRPSTTAEVILTSWADRSTTFLAWQWYDTGTIRGARRLEVKLSQALARLMGRDPGGIAVIIATPFTELGEARSRLSEFASDPGLRLAALKRFARTPASAQGETTN